jgi:hypothetical protein
MDEPRRAVADLGLAIEGVGSPRRWTRGPDAMGALASRARHQPDPELAAILVEPNGFALKDPLALVAKPAVSPGAGKIDRGSPIGSPDVVGHSVPDLGPVRHPGASSAGVAGSVAKTVRFLGRHKVLSAILVADAVAMVLWWA